MLTSTTSPSTTPTDPLGDAPAAITACLRVGAREIDALFGEGYARDHPELLGAFIQAGAALAGAAYLAGRMAGLCEALDYINRAIQSTCGD